MRALDILLHDAAELVAELRERGYHDPLDQDGIGDRWDAHVAAVEAELHEAREVLAAVVAWSVVDRLRSLGLMHLDRHEDGPTIEGIADRIEAFLPPRSP